MSDKARPMVSELPPCPICQEEPIEEHDAAMVGCDDCGVQVYGSNPEEAQATWYAMTQANALEELRRELRALQQAAQAYCEASEGLCAALVDEALNATREQGVEATVAKQTAALAARCQAAKAALAALLPAPPAEEPAPS